jgi:hypothetical protein
VHHHPHVTSGGHLPSQRRAEDEVEVRAADLHVAAEGHLEPSALEFERAAEPEVHERVAFGFGRVAELVRELELELREQLALDLHAPPSPGGVRVDDVGLERRTPERRFEPGAQDAPRAPSRTARSGVPSS